MKINKIYWLLALLTLMEMLVGCVGTQTFTTAARSGETIALAVGYQQKLKRENVTVTITDAAGSVAVYPPGSSQVRSILNLYPDPVSRAVVGTRTAQTLDTNANMTGTSINQYATNNDPDWWQTTIIMNLPTMMTSPNIAIAPGVATITIIDNLGASIRPIQVEILQGISTANPFNVDYKGGTVGLTAYRPQALVNMERADSYTIRLSNIDKTANGTDVVPHSIQLDFTHTVGIGKPWVVNQNADFKSIIWSDDGAGNLRVLITPTNGVTLNAIIKQKFYIAGNITGLSQPTVKAYDINGTLMPGVTATVTPQ